MRAAARIAIALACGVATAVPPWGAAAARLTAAAAELRRARDPVPAVLVHGPPFDAYRAWGWPDPSLPHRAGLFHRLYAAGYRAERTLFPVPSDARLSLPQAAAELARAVRAAAARAPGGRVYVIAYSTGALVARYALDAGLLGQGPPVARLVLLAPLDRGSAVGELVHRLALRQAALERLRGQGLSGPARPGLPPFEGEVPYVALRALRWYVPLYRRYLEQTRLLAPPSAAVEPPPFADWVGAMGPEAAAPLRDPAPPLGLAPLPADGGAPKPGRDLSRAYYERVAMDVARDAYRLLRPARELALDGWLDDIPARGGPVERVKEFLLKRALRLLTALFGRWLELGARQRALEAVRQWLEVDPFSDFGRLAVRERADGVVANAYLAAWNGAPAARVARAWVASAPLPAGVPLAGMGPNDGVAELPAPGPEPALILRGPRAPLHHRVPEHARVQDFVLGLLMPPDPPVAAADRPALPAGRERPAGAGRAVPREGGGVPAVRPAGGAVRGAPAEPPGAPARDEVPTIHVIRRSRLTTRLRPEGDPHARWVWDFGDGTRWEDGDPAHAEVAVAHRYAEPGTYTVRATSYAASGAAILTRQWTVRVGQPEQAVGLDAASVAAPRVVLAVQGPAAWIVGRPAEFRLEAEVAAPPYGEVVGLRYHPAARFRVVWHRPGNGFRVVGAVTVRVRYRLPGGITRVRAFTFTAERGVDVAAPGLSGR